MSNLGTKDNCVNCTWNEASNEPDENIGYCDLKDIEFVNSESKRCKRFNARILILED